MESQRPVVVIGAGAAGIAAALAATETSLTILLDERPDRADAIALARVGVNFRPGTSVWALFDGPVVAAYNAERAFAVDAGAVVIATGGIDRTWPVSGWHLDGVMTVGDIREGDLRYGVVRIGKHAEEAVAAIETAGGSVVAVAELAAARIEGETRVERLDGVPVDRVLLALGRCPDPALALQARAASAFLRDVLIEMPLLATDGATSLPGVFVAGEAAGVTGDDAIRAHGERAGRAAAAVAGGESQSADLRAPSIAANPPLPLPDDPATIVCREQGVDLRTVRAALDNGAYDVNDLRRRTRAGMGCSGGREVLPVLAALLLESDQSLPDDRLLGRHRPPTRPLPFRVVLDTPEEHRS